MGDTEWNTGSGDQFGDRSGDQSGNQWELVFGYVHCIGRTTWCAGVVGSEDEAETWVEKQKAGNCPRPGAPEADPVRWCPVRHCHVKYQRPWVGYRCQAPGGETTKT